MKNLIKPISLALVCALVSGTCGWLLRGSIQPTVEDQFMIANEMAEEHLIRIVFPSGKTIERRLEGQSSMTIKIENRGEGSLRVYVDDELKTKPEGDGYLSNKDRAVVLSVNDRDISLHTFRARHEVPGAEFSGWEVSK